MLTATGFTSPDLDRRVAEQELAGRPRRRRVALVKRALSYARRQGWASDPTLAPDGLIAAATATAGLTDFGRETFWHDNLAVLTRSLAKEAALTPLGRVLAHGQLVSLLGSRLRLERLWRVHPEIAD